MPARWWSHCGILLISLCSVPVSSAGETGTETTRPATLQRSVDFSLSRVLSAGDDTLACFTGSQAVLVNPGCFTTIDPAQPGDCTADTGHFFVQYLFPQKTDLERLRGFGFFSNDGSTVFPSAGALLIPIVNGTLRFPTASELANLQRTNIASNRDTSQVFVDLTSEQILVGPGDEVALVLALQFPSGQVVGVGNGPAIAVESSEPDEDCDYFTIDGGTSGAWFSPNYDPGDPNSLPLDWGFVAVFEPLSVPVETTTWSTIKKYFRTL